MAHKEEINQLIEIKLEITKMLELANNNIKVVIITAFHMFKNLSRHIEDIF